MKRQRQKLFRRGFGRRPDDIFIYGIRTGTYSDR